MMKFKYHRAEPYAMFLPPLQGWQIEALYGRQEHSDG